jgi:hypothetical protein
MKSKASLLGAVVMLYSGFAGAQGLNCEEVKCSLVSHTSPIAICTDGQERSMCFLASPASGLQFVCPCDLACFTTSDPNSLELSCRSIKDGRL